MMARAAMRPHEDKPGAIAPPTPRWQTWGFSVGMVTAEAERS
jgi:hypothetical protein